MTIAACIVSREFTGGENLDTLIGAGRTTVTKLTLESEREKGGSTFSWDSNSDCELRQGDEERIVDERVVLSYEVEKQFSEALKINGRLASYFDYCIVPEEDGEYQGYAEWDQRSVSNLRC